MADAETTAAIVHDISEAWHAQRYDDIGSRLADDVVLAVPGSKGRRAGRDVYAQSYRDYDRMAAGRSAGLQTCPPAYQRD